MNHRYDLVQAVMFDGGVRISEELVECPVSTPIHVEMLSIGGDFNHDNLTASDDVSEYLAAYFAEQLSADYNNDGVVSPADAIQCAQEYSNAAP